MVSLKDLHVNYLVWFKPNPAETTLCRVTYVNRETELVGIQLVMAGEPVGTPIRVYAFQLDWAAAGRV